MLNYTPSFVVKNKADVPLTLPNKYKLLPEDQIDLLSCRNSLTEYQLFIELTNPLSSLSQSLRTGALVIISQKTIFSEFAPKNVSATINAQYPLNYSDGLLSISEASINSSGFLTKESYAKVFAGEDMVKVWVSSSLRKDEGPEIHIPMFSDPRIISIINDTATIRSSKRKSKMPAKYYGLGESVSVRYIARSRLVLSNKLPEDAIFYVQAMVKYEDADNISVNAPLGLSSGSSEYAKSLNVINGTIKELTSSEINTSKVESKSFKLVTHGPAGMSLKINGDGSFYTESSIYHGSSPPKTTFEGQMWFNTNLGELLVWSESDNKWAFSKIKEIQFSGAKGDVKSENMPYRVMPRLGKILGYTIESIGQNRISIAIDGKTVSETSASGYNNSSINVPFQQQAVLRVFQDTSIASSDFLITLNIKEFF